MKGKKLIILMVIASLTLVGLAGCSSDSKDSGDKKGEKYALFMTHMSNEFTIELSDAVKAQAKKEGISDLKVYDAGQDAAKQVSQIETAVQQGVDGIIIEPVSVDGIMPAVEAAKAEDVKVVIVNQQIKDPSKADAYVGVSNKAGGKMQMEMAAKDMNNKGGVAFLLGPMGSDAQIGRSEGYQAVMDKNKDIKMVFEKTAEWDTAKALALVENWLQSGKDITAIVAQNDGMALGALKAVQDAGKSDSIKVYGLDATSEALESIEKGELAGTVSQNTTQQGTKAMEIVVKLVKGEKVEKETLVEFVQITKENVKDFMK